MKTPNAFALLSLVFTMNFMPIALGATDMTTSKPAAVAADESFQGSWPYTAHYFPVEGGRLHYIDEGQGEVLLFLHGEPTWGYLFRQQIAALQSQYRVVAVDHLGFGKSDTPDDRTYYLQDHIDNLEALVLGLDLQDITLVMHDFGGPTGMGLLSRHPQRIKRIISVNGPTPLGQPDLMDRLVANVRESPWFQWIMEANENGTLRKVLEESHYSILSTLKLNGFVDNSIITPTWLNAYRAPFPEAAYSHGVIGWAEGFAQGKHRFEEPNAAATAHAASLPAVAIWGRQDATLHGKHFLPLFRQAFPRGAVYEIDDAGHYSPEDQPAQITRLIEQFLEQSR